MSELTTIPSSAGAAGLPAPARFFAGPRGFKLRPDLVLIGVAGLRHHDSGVRGSPKHEAVRLTDLQFLGRDVGRPLEM
jgi:hypothetical protein